MHGDFTLDPLQYRAGVSRVLTQQGRVQLDSDANEQTESLLRFLRGLARDLIGPHGGVHNSFRIDDNPAKPFELRIERGEYYVDGIRCVLPLPGDFWELYDNTPANDAARRFVPLPQLPNFVPPDDEDRNRSLLFYLDVYERHISASEDDSLREVALLGADTASRAVVTWHIRTLVIDEELNGLGQTLKQAWPFNELDSWYVALNLLLRSHVRMRAEAIGSESTNPCIIAPEARYRGTENRLLRVEIHDGGQPAGAAQPAKKPTIKWSRDNGSIVYPVRRVSGTTVHLGSLGRDARTQICVNDWVEVVDDDAAIAHQFHPLLQVLEVLPAEMAVVLSGAPDGQIGSDVKKHPILRRWESDLIEVDVREAGRDAWIELADGVQVEFSRAARPLAGFRPGDYWLIPTRTAGGQLLWPRENGVARDLPANGADHHYAPLLALFIDEANRIHVHLNRSFQQLTEID